MTVPIITKQHAEDASTKYWQRKLRLRDPRTQFEQLFIFDQAIIAHLDGMLEAGQAGLDQAYASYERSINVMSADAGADCFVVLALAFFTDDMPTMQEVVQRVAGKRGFAEALEGIFAWFGTKNIGALIGAQLSHKHEDCRHAALNQCHVYHSVGSKALQQALADSPPESLSLALNAVGRCGNVDLLDLITRYLIDGNPGPFESFCAARSALLLGERNHAIRVLRIAAMEDAPFALDALKLLCLALESGPLHEFLGVVEQRSGDKLPLIQAAGWSGNPDYVPLLLSLIADDATGRHAGEAFRQITGLPIDGQFAKAEPDDGKRSNRTYPMPDGERVSQWWQDNKDHFAGYKRLFLSQPITAGWLLEMLGNAEQAHRELAALHYSLLRPGTPLFPTHAGTHRQLQILRDLQGTTE